MMSQTTISRPEKVSDGVCFSYEKYLSTLPFEQAVALAKSWCLALKIDDKNNSVDLSKNVVLQSSHVGFFLGPMSSYIVVEKIILSLPGQEYEFLCDCVKRGTQKKAVQYSASREKVARSLEQKGLLFPGVHAEESFFSVPVEIIFVVSFHLTERRENLAPCLALGIYSFYTASFLSHIAQYIGVITKGKNKFSMAIAVYKKITEDLEGGIPALSTVEKEILKYIYSWGEAILDEELNEGLKLSSSSFNYSYSDNLFDFLRNPRSSFRLSEKAGAFISLICKGLVSFKSGQYYQSFEFFIPQEASRIVEQIFWQDQEEKYQLLHKDLFAAEPLKIVSFSKSVFDDLIKVQLAVVCGFLEVTQQDSFRKKSIKEISKVTGVPEKYLIHLLSCFELSVDSMQGKCSLDKVEFNSYQLIEKLLLKDKIFRKILSALSVEKRWIKTRHLSDYLLLSRETYALRKHLNDDALRTTVDFLVSLGLLEISADLSCVKISGTAMDIINGKAATAASLPVIKAQSKPLIVQPNLDLLLAYNCDLKLISQIAEFSEIISIDKAIHFKISQASIVRAIDKDWNVKQIKAFIEQTTSLPVPTTVYQFLDSLGEKEGEAVVYSCSAVIQCRGVMLKERILSIKQLKCSVIKGHDDLVQVRNADSAAVMAALKKNGILATANLELSRDASIEEKIEFYLMKKCVVTISTCSSAGKMKKIPPARIRHFNGIWVSVEYAVMADVNKRVGREDEIFLESIVDVEECLEHALQP